MSYETLQKIIKDTLTALDGKKTLIMGIIMSVVAYLAVKGYIGDAETMLVSSIITVLGYGSSVATTYYRNK